MCSMAQYGQAHVGPMSASISCRSYVPPELETLGSRHLQVKLAAKLVCASGLHCSNFLVPPDQLHFSGIVLIAVQASIEG